MVVAAFFLSACACGLPAHGLDQATQQLPGFAHRRLAGVDFSLHAWLHLAGPGETLTVVIEGDRAGWFNRRWPPADPTPERSQALALAAHLPGAVAYLARPCQFEQGKACRAEHWTSHRFAVELVGAPDPARVRFLFFRESRQRQQDSGRKPSAPEEVLRRRSVLVLTSGDEEPVADEGKGGHSIFAWNLIRALEKAGALTPGYEAWRTVHQGVTREHPQTPQYGKIAAAGHQEGGEYLSERGANP